MRVCNICGDDFDPKSLDKIRAGGKINECPDCSVERAPVSVGVGAGDGKTTLITIMRFPNQTNADAYMKAYKNSTGFNKGRSCHLGTTNIMHTDRLGGQMIAEFGGNPNAKGKM